MRRKILKKIDPKFVDNLLGVAVNRGCLVYSEDNKLLKNYYIQLDRQIEVNGISPKYIALEEMKWKRKESLYKVTLFDEDGRWRVYTRKFQKSN